MVTIPLIFQDEFDAAAAKAKERREVRERLKSERQAVINDLEIIDYKWNPNAGFGSILMASFSIKNGSEKPVKDIEVECVHYGPSGTKIDSNRRVIYERIEPGETLQISDFNMGFIHSQAHKSGAYVVDAVILEIPTDSSPTSSDES